MKDVFLSIKYRPAACPHAVDLLIVIKRRILFLPRRGDHHGIHRRLLQRNIAGEGLAVAEVFEVTADTALPVRFDKFHRQPLIPVYHISFC